MNFVKAILLMLMNEKALTIFLFIYKTRLEDVKMARADLLCELIKAGLRKDDMTFRRATQAICAEERTKQHEILANK